MGRTILVIDDDYFMQKLMEVMLLKDGHTVMVAGDANEAFGILTKNHIEIITCDIMMPEVDGLDFLRQLKADAQLNQIPVIIITAAGDQQIIRDAMGIGAYGVLEKPFTDNELKRMIRDVA